MLGNEVIAEGDMKGGMSRIEQKIGPVATQRAFDMTKMLLPVCVLHVLWL